MRYTRETLRRVEATRAAVDTAYPAARSLTLLTRSNPKVQKQATERGYLPALLHLAPHTMGGVNVCPWATTGEAGCVRVCLNTAGRGGIKLDAAGWNPIQAARIRRTALFALDPDTFADQLAREVAALARHARRLDLTPCLRLNGTSDLPFHRMMPSVVASALEAGVVLYDYTKRPKPDAAAHGIDLTYSYPGGEGAAARRYLEAGHRVAVVFDTPKGQPLPHSWRTPWGDTVPVVDGDRHDFRFLDPAGVAVGLRAKGQAARVKGTRTGFVQAAA